MLVIKLLSIKRGGISGIFLSLQIVTVTGFEPTNEDSLQSAYVT